MRWPALVLLLAGCMQPEALPDPDLGYWVDVPGDPVPGLDADTLASFERGREVMEKGFTPEEGLGPSFNTDSCASCHQAPAVGGSAPRYRDFFLVFEQRWDGAKVDAGSNGQSPVRNLYDLEHGHVAEPEELLVRARRNAPAGLGIGLFAFIEDEVLLEREDGFDDDGDGISGRANYEQNQVGRFGYKAQASTLESFNRGAMLNQMGVTSNPLFYDFPADPGWLARAGQLVLPYAHAQVAAPGEPTVDDDGIADPEMSDGDQLDLLLFSTYLAPLRPSEPDETVIAGARHFEDVGCASCHVPALESTQGPLYAYTDLLLHDLGEDLDDGVSPGLASSAEFRTAPLWGVVLHGPFLHDGSASTLDEAILAHGGEGESAALAYAALETAEQEALLAFLASLGGEDPGGQLLTDAFHAVPQDGELGGPIAGLTAAEQDRFYEGLALFDRTNTLEDGLGPHFNADSCRACHQDPVLGGAGGIDTNVLRVDVDGPFLSRQVVPGEDPQRLSDESTVVEWRQPPPVFGVGLLDAVSDDAIVANADEDDSDGDGISGRARWLSDGQLGRFGWKAQIPSVEDFVADALVNELGATADPALSDFTRSDDDAVADPEVGEGDFDDLAFYLRHLAAPESAASAEGEALFAEVGCASCHVPELDGVVAWTDLLLHDVAPEGAALVDQEDGVEPGEFRTPPLWGIGETGPYLHDGRASTLTAAIAGHAGEASAAADAFAALGPEDQQVLLDFLAGL